MSARARPRWNQKVFVTLEGAWVELRAENPAELMRCAVEVGLMEVKHRGHPYYFMAPGGQVFTIAPMGQRE